MYFLGQAEGDEAGLAALYRRLCRSHVGPEGYKKKSAKSRGRKAMSICTMHRITQIRCCVTLGKSQNLSGPHFLYLQVIEL